MDIATVIPYGMENAVTRTELQHITGYSDRKVRDLIETAQCSGIPILNLQNGKGYFKPKQEEKSIFERWAKQESSRGNKCIRKVRIMKQSFYLKSQSGSRTQVSNQMNIFDFLGGVADG